MVGNKLIATNSILQIIAIHAVEFFSQIPDNEYIFSLDRCSYSTDFQSKIYGRSSRKGSRGWPFSAKGPPPIDPFTPEILQCTSLPSLLSSGASCYQTSPQMSNGFSREYS